MNLFQKLPATQNSLAVRTYPPEEVRTDDTQVIRHEASLRAWAEHHHFDIQKLKGIEGWPLIYWWDEAFLQRYLDEKKLGEETEVRVGMQTANNKRFYDRIGRSIQKMHY